jgi:4-hydroxybenzoate polyprenyltransferase
MDTATTPARAQPSFASRCRAFAADIKLSHTIFALPWALLATFLAAGDNTGGLPYAGQVALILVCMVAARTFAMGMNRLIDARLDRLNPRPAARAIPGGRLSPGFVAAAAGACAGIFLLSCGGFWLLYRNPWPALLGPLVLAFLGAYPYLKRFTRFCHYYLGAALALAPVCAWIAIRGEVDPPPLLMAAAVLLWTAGFDIIYACQDYASDVQTGVFSVPAKLGVGAALWVARLTHALCVAALLVLGWIVPQFGLIYDAAVVIAVALLVIEHSLVKPDDLSKVNLAFFTINGVISLVIGTLGVIDVYA